MGAYHASDIPMVFGTYAAQTPGRVGAVELITPFEPRVAEAMQDHVLAFMEDPENGLRRRGWLAHGEVEETPGVKVRGTNMARFAAGGWWKGAGDVEDASELGAKYNSSPLKERKEARGERPRGLGPWMTTQTFKKSFLEPI